MAYRRFETRDFQTQLLPLELAHSKQVPVTCLNLEREILLDLYPGSKEGLGRRLGTLDSTGPRVSLISILSPHGNDGVYIETIQTRPTFVGRFHTPKSLLDRSSDEIPTESKVATVLNSPLPSPQRKKIPTGVSFLTASFPPQIL
ncbi:uncharacterized protein CDAR_509871 [Caerostris darwini]|uniref:Uncharacterized protein n=1 Tax=Caerostris darwini TaxID=1538125 RepID=A0AAV4TW30_9ARAC|nr:uncharacterized protein CDAR_509871 [Caerostris darwini]